ncbi:uncharacterized protein BXZ73DRAFT_91452 [Epithele typhae]|uniref:uncharacterized protein n=1 Tax=Epithele typhae TaxID=378194 RepID=UPI002007CF2D|nr:uncharacterized protein BXZ73DRAFT_91452 [Epithele typhae]KAH9923447.1 hypothetical protein BXZ73DRAFT_91452 [Epithele typhae]
MATQTQSPSPFSRLSRLAFPFKTNSPSPLTADRADEWYIPYNGPLEPPKDLRKDERSTDSWGHMVSDWLMQNDAGARTRVRAMSNASRATGDDGRRGTFANFSGDGGIGDSPAPARPRKSQESSAPAHRRASFASILSFGKQRGSVASPRIHPSMSTGTLRDDSVPPLPPPTHSTLPKQLQGLSQQPEGSNSHTLLSRRHPYALASPTTPSTQNSSISSPVFAPVSSKVAKFSVQLLDPLNRKSTAPAYLLPAKRTDRLSIKASMSTPNLRAASDRGRCSPRATWCDALILARPRFALRVDGEGSSGRIVSPPPSPIWPPGMEPGAQRLPPISEKKTLKKSQSAVQLRSRPEPPSPPFAIPTVGRSSSAQDQMQPQPQAGPSTVRREDLPAGGGDASLKPWRPKSWALDDLAVPSPVPSLAKVLEDGRQLEADRAAWQKQASKSFGGNRARSVSRARSKSVGGRSRARPLEPSALDTFAEATLLSAQKRRPTIHVRPPRSDGHASSSGGVTTTMTGTYTSGTHPPLSGGTRSRSHAHSASLGSISVPRSDDSFMWTPGHGRNHSLGKSALRIVHNTAAMCGVGSGHDKSHAPRTLTDEKAAAMEAALRHGGTKIIHLRDQVGRERIIDNGVVVITPPPSAGTIEIGPAVGPGGLHGTSPTPSGNSSSAEGVGIAIGSPLPTPELLDQEPIRIPAHPYAQGLFWRARVQTDVKPGPSEDTASSPTSTAGESSTRHRQPVILHPYSPYSSIPHPYSNITSTSKAATAAPAQHRNRPNKYLDVRPSPLSSMFAELSPGTIREIMPDEIHGSSSSGHKTPSPEPVVPPVHGHPYGPPSKRTSEWGFADALTHTLRGRASQDSGLGTSETHEVPPLPQPVITHTPDDSEDVVVISPSAEEDGIVEARDILGVRSRTDSSNVGGRRPGMTPRETTGTSSNHTLASSTMESVDPPTFQVAPSPNPSHRSGSSPGEVSISSSPPVSPHPFSATENDMQQFRDLFYRPPLERSPEHGQPPVHHTKTSIPIELSGGRSTRSLSGLTTLARQLSVNLGELQDHEEALEQLEGRGSPWSTASVYSRGEDGQPMPVRVGSQSSSLRSGFRREGGQSPLRLPLDAEGAYPANRHMRVGSIEAVSTPPAVTEPMRFSTHLDEYPSSEAATSPTDTRKSRIVSTRSSLAHCEPPVHLHAYYDDPSRESMAVDTPVEIDEQDDIVLDPGRPVLTRETSTTTFGGRQQMGEAL